MSTNKKTRSLWGSRSEAQRIYYQRQTIKKLEQENEKLKKQYCERTDCCGRLGNSKKVEELIKENEKLNHYKLLYQKVKDRNDKAIEYVETHRVDYFNEGVLYATEFDSISSPYYLLSILKDNDNEE